jgi:hypothetical protein
LYLRAISTILGGDGFQQTLYRMRGDSSRVIRRPAMRVEEQYLDVLQNIEFAIVRTYREHPEMTDYEVMHVLEALLDRYKAETLGRPLHEQMLSQLEAVLYGAVHEMCEWRLGRGERAEQDGPAPEPISVEAMILCLKKILSSVTKSNKTDGRRGYLTFIVQYVR